MRGCIRGLLHQHGVCRLAEPWRDLHIEFRQQHEGVGTSPLEHLLHIHLPVIELAHLTPAQRRAYVIADNRLALDAGWDDELLTLELGELRESGFDLGLTGFNDHELKSFLDDPDEPKASITEAKSAVCPGCGQRFAL